MTILKGIACWLLLMACAVCATGNDYEESLRHYRHNELDSALHAIDRAMGRYERDGRDDSLVFAITHKALVYVSKFGLAAARRLMDGAMAVVDRLPMQSVARVAAYTRLGQLDVQRYDLSEARRYFRKAEGSMVNGQPANRHYVILYHAMAQLHLSAQHYQLAQEYALKAYEMNLEVEGRDGALMANIWQTRYYVNYYQGHHDEALRDGLAFQRAVQSHYPADHPNVGMMHNSLSEVYHALELPERALHHQHRAVDVHYSNYVQTGNGYTLAGAYSNLGGLYYALHEYYLANEYLTKAQDLLEATFGEFGPGMLETLVMLGSTKQKLGLADAGRKAFDRAYRLQQTHAAEEISKQAYIESYYGDFHASQGRFPEAIDYYDRAMANYRRIGDANAYYSLYAKADKGAALGELGRWDEAIALQREAQDDFREHFHQLGNRARSFYDGISTTYRNMGRLDDAIAYSDSVLLKSLALDRLPPDASQWVARLPYTFNSCTYLLNRVSILFRIHGQTGNRQPLLDLLGIIDAYGALLAANLYTFRSQAPLVEQADVNKQLFSLGIEACWALSASGADAKYLEKALEYAERGKALLLRLAANNLMVDAAGGEDDGVAARDRDFRIKVNSLNEQYLNAAGASDSLLRLLTVAMEGYRLFQDSLKRSGHGAFAIKYDLDPASLPAIRNTLLRKRETLIHYAVTEESVFAFVITASGFHVHRLKKEALEDIHALQALHRLSATQFVAPAHRLYRQLVEPLVPHFASNRIFVIPDAELHYLNFELLLQHGRETNFGRMPFLIRQYTFSYLLSASNALRFKAARHDSERSKAMLFVPVFTPEMKAAFRATLPSTGADSEPYLFLNRQPFSLRAAERIGRFIAHDLFVEQQAQESIFKQVAKDYRVLHLGTHAEVNNHSPLQSRLFFAKGLPDGTLHADDGYLYAYEVYAMQLRAELAVLTACETGAGALRQGEGVVSLAHSFLHAGCSGVVMALWKIDEKANADIISRFYENLSTGMDRSDALRKAKLHFMQSDHPEWNHPYYWAGLALIGDSTPIYQRHTWPYWVIGSMLTALATVVFLRQRRRRSGMKQQYYRKGP